MLQATDEGTALLGRARRRPRATLAVAATCLLATSLRAGGAFAARRWRVRGAETASLAASRGGGGAVSPADAVSVQSSECGYPAMQLVCTVHLEVNRQRAGDA